MEDTLAKVQKSFESAFGIDPQTVTIESTPADIPEWDSMGHVVLASSLESAFGLTFEVEELMEMEDVKKIVEVVESKLERAECVQV